MLGKETLVLLEGFLVILLQVLVFGVFVTWAQLRNLDKSLDSGSSPTEAVHRNKHSSLPHPPTAKTVIHFDTEAPFDL